MYNSACVVRSVAAVRYASLVFEGGPSATTRAGHCHADAWRTVWALHEARDFPVMAAKCKAHVADSDIDAGYPQRLKDGNSCADAAAKDGLAEHDVPGDLLRDTLLVFGFAVYIAKFATRMHAAALRLAADAPRWDRRTFRSASVRSTTPFR